MHAGRVLVVEDEDLISEPLCELLRIEGFDVRVARTAAEGLAMATGDEPDIVLLDVMLPDGNGRDLCRLLRSRSDVPIVMVTARGQVHDRVIGLELGADDYIVKPFDSDEVIARIRAILRRTHAPSPPQAVTGGGGSLHFGHLEIDLPARAVRCRGAPVALSRKEYDLLALLAQRPGEVVRREEIMSEVWDRNWWGSDRTLTVHVNSLREKLGDVGDQKLIETRRGVGYILRVPEALPSA